MDKSIEKVCFICYYDQISTQKVVSKISYSKMKPLSIPTFTEQNQAFQEIRAGKTKPIVIMIFGTIWSPPCRYTMQALTNVIQEKKYSELVDAVFLNQEASLDLCFDEKILVGFPSIYVFVNSSIVPFVNEFDTSQSSKSNKPLVHQCNEKQIRQICDSAIESLEGKSDLISFNF